MVTTRAYLGVCILLFSSLLFGNLPSQNEFANNPPKNDPVFYAVLARAATRGSKATAQEVLTYHCINATVKEHKKCKATDKKNGNTNMIAVVDSNNALHIGINEGEKDERGDVSTDDVKKMRDIINDIIKPFIYAHAINDNCKLPKHVTTLIGIGLGGVWASKLHINHHIGEKIITFNSKFESFKNQKNVFFDKNQLHLACRREDGAPPESDSKLYVWLTSHHDKKDKKRMMHFVHTMKVLNWPQVAGISKK